ncbi:flagellar basal body rod protein FlgB [Desulfoluna butyratoxydans]|uniref:Flagellar basal body rod protein FlgB n=1 Tax=Desulfoluna butyratoxydans TaxID=231438 RepID=A0A4U8YPC1_9BACT|nr:flagellar basal body rod protein FlgB [Desulfoluna butyratoxydans]VFQ43522.1 flagellar basal-body rod protein flgb [Desulfoluna butyratoxydans]
MSRDLPIDSTYAMLGKAMDVSARRHNLITGNIANMDTVGYKAKDLDFQKTLEMEMTRGGGPLDRTHDKHLQGRPAGAFDAEMEEDAPVDLDREMSRLVENNIRYRSTVEMMMRKVATLRDAIGEGVK